MSLNLIGQEQALARLEAALKTSTAEQTELLLLRRSQAVTRYAHGEIHQNVYQDDVQVGVRVVVNGAVARLTVHSLEPDALARTLAQAVATAKLLQPNPLFKSLAGPQADSTGPATAPYFYASVAGQLPQTRADAVREIVAAAEGAGFASFGTYKATVDELAVVNSLGVRAYAPSTTAYLRALFDNGQGTGYADALSRDADELDAAALGRTAAEKCRLNQNQREIAPGDYAVVLEPDCVADMVRFPVGWGLHARAVQDGYSFMIDKLGQRVTGAQVTLWDDARDPRCRPLAIDYEGQPTQRVNLITNGVAEGVVYDSYTASQEPGKTTTGHAYNPFEYGDAVLPANVLMAAGEASISDLVSHLERGLLVTRLHYTHCPDPQRVVATGTTRDGTFLVEDGKIVAAVRNLRFTQSVLELLDTVEELGQAKLCQDWWSQNGMGDINYYVPALRIGRCTFTGVTTF